MTTLSDIEIANAINSQGLIINSASGNVAGACYELRMGDVYYDLSENAKRFQLGPGDTALIKPGHRVVLITAEEFRVPNDMLVRIVSKGSLFSIGLSAVATYADPGFHGNMGIVTENVSDKYIVLPQGEAIAKADFTRLSRPANATYRGPHGFQQGIWPLKTQLQKEYFEVEGDPRVASERNEALALLPAATRTIIRGIETTQFWTNVGLVLAIVLNAATMFLISNQLIDSMLGIVGNLVASAIIGLSAIIAGYVRRNT